MSHLEVYPSALNSDRFEMVALGSIVVERAERASLMELPALSVGKLGVTAQLEGVAKQNSEVLRKVVRKGDLVINSRADRKGAAGLSLYEGSVSPVYSVMIPKAELLSAKYGHYLLRSVAFQEEFFRGGTGIVSDLWSTNFTRMARIRVPLPPLTIQNSIASYLDRETGEIDAMLAKLASLSESVSERRREIVRSILKSVGQTVRLGLVVDVVSGSGFPDRFQGISDEELPFYKVSSLSNVDRQVLTDSDNTVSREIADQLGARVIPSQSVVMAKIGAALLLARYALTERPSCIDNNMQALVPHQGVIISRFLAYAMEGVSIPSLVKPGPVPSLDVMGMKMSRIAYNPSLKEQCRIADHLDEVTGRIDVMLATIDELKALLVERRAALITDVVTGRKKVPA